VRECECECECEEESREMKRNQEDDGITVKGIDLWETNKKSVLGLDV
jgi:hypothetical protein